MPHRYQFQDPYTTLTLREGLREYYEKNPEFVSDADFLAQPRDIVQAHDACHVLFGLTEATRDELLVEVWTAFGCRFTLKDIRKARKIAFVWELWKTFGIYRLVKKLVANMVPVARTIYAARHMKRRWPHAGYEAYLDIPLRDLRRDFGIQLVT